MSRERQRIEELEAALREASDAAEVAAANESAARDEAREHRDRASQLERELDRERGAVGLLARAERELATLEELAEMLWDMVYAASVALDEQLEWRAEHDPALRKKRGRTPGTFRPVASSGEEDES